MCLDISVTKGRKPFTMITRSRVTIVPARQLYYVGRHEPFEFNFCRSIDVELDIDFGHCAQLCEASAPLLAYLINTFGCSPGHCLTGSSLGAKFVVISSRVAHFVVLWSSSSVHANQEKRGIERLYANSFQLISKVEVGI